MVAIKSDLYYRLQDVLLKCNAFADTSQLKSIFVDERIAPWKNQVPHATNAQALVQATIAWLSEQKRHDTNENGLVLLLLVLRDHVDSRDKIYHDLFDLANELKNIYQLDGQNLSLSSASQHQIITPKKFTLSKIFILICFGLIGLVSVLLIGFNNSLISSLPISTPPIGEPTLKNIDTPIPTAEQVNNVETTLNTPTSPPSLTKEVVPYTPIIESFNGYKYAMIPKSYSEGSTPVADFWMGVYEVSNEQFADYLNKNNPSNQCRGGHVCIDKTALNVKIQQSGSQWISIEGYEKHPVVEVSWYGATEFCEAIGGRLPTSAEWTKAASWHPVTGQNTVFPWGDEAPLPNLANYGSQYEETQPINTYPDGRSVIGAYNMSGNVWEFVSDTIGTNRILRGGGWDTPASQIKITSELRKGDGITQNNLGFRCAKSR